MKKLLLLGGSTQQIPPIEYSKSKGYYTILCDYLSDNPGQYVADRYCCVSTTDKEAILEVAINENIDGILAYASDPAAPTAAYVAEKLSLPTNPYRSVELLSQKHLFRKFLKENGFYTPNSVCFSEHLKHYQEQINNLKLPVMVKPADSSGSKGVTFVNDYADFLSAFNTASNISRCKVVQVEEYIPMDHEYLVGGDIFVIDGKVVFWGLLNCHRDVAVNPLVPVGKSYPLLLSKNRIGLIRDEVQKLMDKLNIMFGAFNVELIFDKDDKLYFIEMGPRNGGNMIPDLLGMISGKNMVGASVECALGNFDVDISFKGKHCFYATHNLHSISNGEYKGINFSDEIEPYIVKKVLYKSEGDLIYFFDSANKALGIIFLKFPNAKIMFDYLTSLTEHIKYIIK